MKTSRVLLSWCLLAAAFVAPACGKKGPPLAPMVVLPDRVADLSARRLGDTVYLKFTIPAANADNTKPADLARVDVLAFTAFGPNAILNAQDMVRVASIAVRQPPEPEEPPKPGEKPKPSKPGEKPKPPKAPAPLEPGEDQGAVVNVSETLLPAMQTLTVSSAKAKQAAAPGVRAPLMPLASPLVLPLGGIVPVPAPKRFYVAVGVNHRGQRGGLSARVGVPLTLVPPASPGTPALTVGESAIEIAWRPPADAPAPIQQSIPTATPAAKPPLASAPRGMMLPAPVGYNIYVVAPAGATPPARPPAGPPAAQPPAALNAALLTRPAYRDEGFAFGVERCYEVRAVNASGAAMIAATAATVPAVASTAPRPAASAATGVDAVAAAMMAQRSPAPDAAAPKAAASAVWVESAPSPRVCVTPKDVFAPPVPPSLAAVGSVGVISLIWEGVDAADLAGYLVLRGQAPGGPMTPLFEAPVRETTYRDTTVKPGVRYVYAVVSVDKATPPNRSALSNKAEETAR